MIKFRTFTSKLEGQLAAQLLNENGIRTELRGAKEYVSHLLGSDLGTFDLLIEENKVKEAEALLKQDLRIAHLPEENRVRPQLYFKKAVLYSIFAIFLFPIIFNYYSLMSLKEFLKVEPNASRRIRVSILIILLQIPSFYTLYFMTEAMLKAFKELPV